MRGVGGASALTIPGESNVAPAPIPSAAGSFVRKDRLEVFIVMRLIPKFSTAEAQTCLPVGRGAKQAQRQG